MNPDVCLESLTAAGKQTFHKRWQGFSPGCCNANQELGRVAALRVTHEMVGYRMGMRVDQGLSNE